MKTLLGWSAVSACTVVASFWAFWGALEGFHEGWHHRNAASNLLWLLMYLVPALLISGTGVLAVHWPKPGALVFALLGTGVAAWALSGHFRVTAANWPVLACFTAVPLVLGLLFLVGVPHPRRAAAWTLAAVPLAVALVCGSGPAYRILHRTDDGERGPRVVSGNGVSLIWAGEGPGWDRSGGVSYEEAVRRCAHLTEDGNSLAYIPQNFWRLPTVDELVRSATLHNRNCGGQWHLDIRRATYEMRPDKETPLWDPCSPVTYYWTSTEADSTRVYWVVYDGGVFPKLRSRSPGNVGFRAVRDAD